MTAQTFHDLEWESWSQRAAYYDDLFAGISVQSIAPTLDSLGDLVGQRHLDIACGTGHLVAAASQRGALSEGIDFAPPMIDAAHTNYPGEQFDVADAAQLPYDAGIFDVVTCAFGVSHMTDPQAAGAEAFRVLRGGGTFAFALWFGPQDGNDLYAIIQTAIQTIATVHAALPDTSFRFADRDGCTNLVQQVGFRPPTFKMLPIVWRYTVSHDVIDFVTRLSVRTKMLIESQAPDTQRRILDHIRSE